MPNVPTTDDAITETRLFDLIEQVYAADPQRKARALELASDALAQAPSEESRKRGLAILIEVQETLLRTSEDMRDEALRQMLATMQAARS